MSAPVVIAVGDPDLHDAARAELDLPGVLVVVAGDAASAADQVPDGATVARAVLLAPEDTDAALADIDAQPRVAGARALLVTSRDDRGDAVGAVDSNRLTGVLTWPWTPGALLTEVRAQLADRLRHTPCAPSVDDVRASGDPRSDPGPDHPHAPAGPAGARSSQSGDDVQAPGGSRATLTRDLDLPDDVVTARLLAGVERVLGHRPRLLLPAGTHLTREGRSVQRVFLVLRGRVRLTRQSRAGRVILHHASTGPLIGLLSLPEGARAALDSVTSEPSEVVMLTIDQLDRVMAADREVVTLVASLMTRALSRRLRRSEDLQVELTEVNHELDLERARLAEALVALEEARTELVAQARMAMLGDLAAGIGHELNNPVAALSRAADHLATDLDQLLDHHPEAAPIRAGVAAAQSRVPRSAAQDRALRREITAEVGDDALARRLLAAGCEDAASARRLADAGDAAVTQAALAADVGLSLRNLGLAATKIADLVASFRSYSRPGSSTTGPVDVARSLQAALALTNHRLDGVATDIRLAPVPPVIAHPGRLDQVWTNLLVNAADALAGSGTLAVELGTTPDGVVRVVVTDSGPGIAPENLERIFTPRFSTKDGTVRFGLGLGLALARQIVTESGGTIRAESRPGRTEMIVELPAQEGRMGTGTAGTGATDAGTTRPDAGTARVTPTTRGRTGADASSAGKETT